MLQASRRNFLRTSPPGVVSAHLNHPRFTFCMNVKGRLTHCGAQSTEIHSRILEGDPFNLQRDALVFGKESGRKLSLLKPLLLGTFKSSQDLLGFSACVLTVPEKIWTGAESGEFAVQDSQLSLWDFHHGW